jgi:hypothetical protein
VLLTLLGLALLSASKKRKDIIRFDDEVIRPYYSKASHRIHGIASGSISSLYQDVMRFDDDVVRPYYLKASQRIHGPASSSITSTPDLVESHDTPTTAASSDTVVLADAPSRTTSGCTPTRPSPTFTPEPTTRLMQTIMLNIGELVRRSVNQLVGDHLSMPGPAPPTFEVTVAQLEITFDMLLNNTGLLTALRRQTEVLANHRKSLASTDFLSNRQDVVMALKDALKSATLVGNMLHSIASGVERTHRGFTANAASISWHFSSNDEKGVTYVVDLLREAGEGLDRILVTIDLAQHNLFNATGMLATDVPELVDMAHSNLKTRIEMEPNEGKRDRATEEEMRLLATREDVPIVGEVLQSIGNALVRYRQAVSEQRHAFDGLAALVTRESAEQIIENVMQSLAVLKDKGKKLVV